MSGNVPTIDEASRWGALRREVGRALGAAIMALIVAFIVVLFTSKTPLEAMMQLLTAPGSKPRTIGLWIDDAAKLTITGLAFSLVFQARQFSMGVQGQVYIGALASTYVALSPLGATWAAIPLGLTAAMIAGGFYGFLPGIAKARLGANEIVSSLMLNYIAIELCNFLVRNALPVASAGVLTTVDFPKESVFPPLIPNTRFDLGIGLAIVAVLVVWFALYRTSWGLKLRLVGHNAKFADCAFRDYEHSATLISIYMQSLIAQKYATQCNADFLTDVADGPRKQKDMPPAVEKQVDSCYSAEDITTIKSTVRKVVDTIPQFCDSPNVTEAMRDWADNLKREN